MIRMSLLAVLALAGALPASAQDGPELEARAERHLGVSLPLPDRPVLIGNRLVWKDYALADLCREFDGRLSKVPGQAIYICRRDDFAPRRPIVE